MKKAIIISLSMIIIFTFLSYQAYSQNQEISNSNSTLEKTLIAPCESPKVNDKNDQEILKVEKNNKVFDEDIDLNEDLTLKNVLDTYFNTMNLAGVVISHQTETHAQGEFGQNWWLAFNDKKDGWYIVSTGCSYISCDEIEGYNFPSEMAPVCWDSKNNQLVTQ